jgi:hypothetical protein
MRTIIVVLSVLILVSALSPINSAVETIFTGRPSVKISEGGVSRNVEDLNKDRAINLECVISNLEGKYYWASRENTLLARVESGSFVTFVALNGSGYVRIINPKMKSMTALMSETEEKYDYVEHILIGLRSVSYYGKAK